MEFVAALGRERLQISWQGDERGARVELVDLLWTRIFVRDAFWELANPLNFKSV